MKIQIPLVVTQSLYVFFGTDIEGNGKIESVANAIFDFLITTPSFGKYSQKQVTILDKNYYSYISKEFDFSEYKLLSSVLLAISYIGFVVLNILFTPFTPPKLPQSTSLLNAIVNSAMFIGLPFTARVIIPCAINVYCISLIFATGLKLLSFGLNRSFFKNNVKLINLKMDEINKSTINEFYFSPKLVHDISKNHDISQFFKEQPSDLITSMPEDAITQIIVSHSDTKDFYSLTATCKQFFILNQRIIPKVIQKAILNSIKTIFPQKIYDTFSTLKIQFDGFNNLPAHRISNTPNNFVFQMNNSSKLFGASYDLDYSYQYLPSPLIDLKTMPNNIIVGKYPVPFIALKVTHCTLKKLSMFEKIKESFFKFNIPKSISEEERIVILTKAGTHESTFSILWVDSYFVCEKYHISFDYEDWFSEALKGDVVTFGPNENSKYLPAPFDHVPVCQLSKN